MIHVLLRYKNTEMISFKARFVSLLGDSVRLTMVGGQSEVRLSELSWMSMSPVRE